MTFMKEINTLNKKKAEISTKITPIVYELERMRAMNKESLHRIETIKKRIPFLEENSKQREEKKELLRITSYNVCYTKLLRIFSAVSVNRICFT